MAINTATRNVWGKAANVPNRRKDFRGLQGVVYWTVPRMMLEKLDAKAPSDAGALRSILAGGTWPQVRVAEVDKEAVKTCPCCNLADEDPCHSLYIGGSHNKCRLQQEHIRMLAQQELKHLDAMTG
eukprot:4971974-Heterocapsa_arctica.AAC.1